MQMFYIQMMEVRLQHMVQLQQRLPEVDILIADSYIVSLCTCYLCFGVLCISSVLQNCLVC